MKNPFKPVKLFKWPAAWTKWAIIAFLALGALGLYWSRPAVAADLEFAVGTPQANSCCEGFVGNVAIVTKDNWEFGIGAFTDEHHSGRGDVDAYWYITAAKLVYFRPEKSLQPYLGLGVVVLPSGANEVVTLPIDFYLQTGLLWKKTWFVEWQHFSNGGLNEETNPGQDAMVAGFRWRF